MKKILIAILLAIGLLAGSVTGAPLALAGTISKADDPTRNLTKAERKSITFDVWVNSPTAKHVKKAESHNNCKSTGGHGKYQGTWQVSAGFWKSYGGNKYASKASKATCQQQDLVAYKGWLARGWSPWPPAKNFKP
ncbi:MAG: transglycosylase family protein [Actinomycetes bacterium]|jgi:hypothetical protein